MTASQTIYVLKWLIRDTFRQALASRVFWIMLGVSAVFIVFCLSISMESGAVRDPELKEYLDPITGKPLQPGDTRAKMTVLFGMFSYEEFRGKSEQVHFLEVLLASYVASGAGLLLTLLWTAGFLPDFLQPSSAAVLCAKPVPRWALLLGKYLGVVAFVTVQVAFFFGGTWLALSLRTGEWLYGYLAGIPLLVFHFAVIYSFSVLVAVWTRSTIACLFGSTMFWLLCWSMNLGHHYIATQVPQLASIFAEAGYWVLPKPVDIILLLEQIIGTGEHQGTLANVVHLPELQRAGGFHPEMSLLTSALFSVLMLLLSGYELSGTDY
jgi:ABC-type transport system involved in multi-copper enzyme maturation permease subunit